MPTFVWQQLHACCNASHLALSWHPLTRLTQAQVLTSSTEIEMWGDGKQTRSFTFIDDCVEGILRVTKSDVKEVCALKRHCSMSETATTLSSPLHTPAEVGGPGLLKPYYHRL